MRCLVADDQKEFAGLVASVIRQSNHELVGVVTEGGFGTIQAYEKTRPDVVLMDYMMPRLNGLTACRQICSRHSDARIVLMSGIENLEAAAIGSGAVATLKKPFRPKDLLELLADLDASSAVTAEPA